MQSIVDAACARGRDKALTGQVATYIPELAQAAPGWFGIAVHTLDGQTFTAGDVDRPFTLQSVSKVFALARAEAAGVDPYRQVQVEPSGDAFHSIVRLEEERGRPRNPLINAGAIVVSSLLPGASPADRVQRLGAWLGDCAGGEPLTVDDAVYRSECRTGDRNRALAHYMAHHRVLTDPDDAVETYFRQCSLATTARQLARLSRFLAHRGVDPERGEAVVSPDTARRVLALMTTCGLYDEAGRFALDVGLPAKSGVSGCILAIVPGRMAIVTYGPALGPGGNSVAGVAALRHLSEGLDLSLFTGPG